MNGSVELFHRISTAVSDAIMNGSVVAITTIGEFGNKTLVGVVRSIVPSEQKLIVQMRSGTFRISLEKIIDIELM